jgi:hypothetical protein
MFNLSGIMDSACAPLAKPLAYDTPTPAQATRLEAFLREPVELVSLTRKLQSFPLPEKLFSLSIQAPQTQGDRPVATLTFQPEGWDRFSYEYLQSMAAAAKKDPKSIPRSWRPFSKLMARLPEEPTGNGAIDSSRRVVIEKNIQSVAPTIREILEHRLRTWRP